jgi:hemolysin activation/secretion protein
MPPRIGGISISMTRLTCLLPALLLAAPAVAQTVARDAAATLGRDLGAQPTVPDARTVPLPGTVQTDLPAVLTDAGSGGLFVGAVNVEGSREVPRDIFAPIIEPFLGKQADPADLQKMARAVANAARDRGYLFASAIVPEQMVDAGTVTVRFDAGSIDRVQIKGSNNAKLRRILNRIVGKAVRKADFERQLLLASDLPGIIILSTRYAREASGAALFVDVRENGVSGTVGLDNYGSQELGPARARLRLDLTGLLDDSDQLTTQVVMTPLQPGELAYGSMRYQITLRSGAMQIGVAGAVGRTKPGGAVIAGRLSGESLYGALYINQAILRTNRSSWWVNGELAYLRVNQDFGGLPRQQDRIATLTLSTTASTRFAGGRLWGGFGVVQGLPIGDVTRDNDPASSRFDGSALFTKATAWMNWTGNLSKQLSLRLAANGQLASRPLLSAQEIGVGGPGFGRGYDFSERFGDNGVLGLVEIREQFDDLLPGVDWVQVYQFADGGYVENMAGGFGDGTRWSAGAGLRAAMGKTTIALELAFPLNARRSDKNSKSPRVNLSVIQDF